MPIVLPYDIWCLIATFIPKSALSKLYGVNSAFFNILMNEAYREVNIYHVGDERTRRCLMNMSPTIAKRVQTLTLRPHLLPPVDSRKPATFFTEKLRNYIRQAGKPMKPSTNSVPQTLLRHITHMTEVASLTIGCYPSDDVQLFSKATSFVHTAFSTHGSRLLSLTLAIPLEAYSNVLHSTAVFGSLEELEITLRVAYATTDYQKILPLIATFVNQHSGTLKSLSVDTPEAMVDPFQLFSNLHNLPRLRKLCICHPLDRLRPNCPTGIESFLIQHAELLKDFRIRFVGPFKDDPLPSPDDFFLHPILQAQLPNLATLDLGLCQWPKVHKKSVGDNIARYLRPLRKSLSRLAVRDYVLTFPEVESLVTVFSCRESRLRSLEMHMYFLSCDLLDLLYKHLPDLYHLELRFDSLLSQDDGTWIANYYWNGYDVTSAFVRDMADRHYADWALRHFTVQPLYYCSGRWNECRTLLAAALPSVLTFNGLSGDQFSYIPDFTRPDI
ncbi:hypothetical protein GALMADRAFT_73578 [Galerina marginata CBS 339.88]|uniref:F-box domain-containing protein n=1 Tax=Galerina marginata (strain CBS 339.88) TaxID=685588 RepID=A0A067SY83_GALM3|nr:hypothetical protein GALMADRAFT_73578 [Galerina marginata CBS 339.88]